jgi:hypothetical protein
MDLARSNFSFVAIAHFCMCISVTRPSCPRPRQPRAQGTAQNINRKYVSHLFLFWLLAALARGSDPSHEAESGCDQLLSNPHNPLHTTY